MPIPVAFYLITNNYLQAAQAKNLIALLHLIFLRGLIQNKEKNV